MKTITLNAYHPWGSHDYAVDLIYRGKIRKTVEGSDYHALITTAKAWAIINGFTHYAIGNATRKEKL